MRRYWCPRFTPECCVVFLLSDKNGVHPTTPEAGQYSGARYNNPDNNRVTDWWVRVFGGDRAVELSNERPVPISDHAIVILVLVSKVVEGILHLIHRIPIQTQ